MCFVKGRSWLVFGLAFNKIGKEKYCGLDLGSNFHLEPWDIWLDSWGMWSTRAGWELHSSCEVWLPDLLLDWVPQKTLPAACWEPLTPYLGAWTFNFPHVTAMPVKGDSYSGKRFRTWGFADKLLHVIEASNH